MSSYLTPEGLRKVREELKQLKTVKRLEIARRIAQAKELGDLSENAEYADAKDEQAFVEGRILELEELEHHAMVVGQTATTDTVSIGLTVTVEKDGELEQYTIVGSNEANPSEKKISNESPIGQALIGHARGDRIQLTLPKGTTTMVVRDIAPYAR